MNKIHIEIRTDDFTYGENTKDFSKDYFLNELENLTTDAQSVISQEKYDIKMHNGSFLYFRLEVKDDNHCVKFELNELPGQCDFYQQCKDLQKILLDCIDHEEINLTKLQKFHDFENYQCGSDFNMEAWEYFRQTGKNLTKISYNQAVKTIHYQQEVFTQYEIYDQDTPWNNTMAALSNFLKWLSNSKEFKVYIKGPKSEPDYREVFYNNGKYFYKDKEVTKQQVITSLKHGKTNITVNGKKIKLTEDHSDFEFIEI